MEVEGRSSRRSALIWPSLDCTSYKRVQFSRSDRRATNVFIVLRKNRVRVRKILGNRNCRNNKRRILGTSYSTWPSRRRWFTSCVQGHKVVRFFLIRKFSITEVRRVGESSSRKKVERSRYEEELGKGEERHSRVTDTGRWQQTAL